jgi:hypothetical protein
VYAREGKRTGVRGRFEPEAAGKLRFIDAGAYLSGMIRTLPALLVLGLAIPAAAAPMAIQPGYWESTNRLLSPIRQKSVEKRCITPADVEKFMAGPSNRHYACTYPTKVIADGRIVLKGTCRSKKGRVVEVQGQGEYTPTSFTLKADIATEFLGLDISGRASTEARRIGDVCPPPPAPEAETKGR